MCVPREALISALVRRARDEGYRVSRDDLRALLDAGVPRTQLHDAFAGDGDALQHARALLAATSPA